MAVSIRPMAPDDYDSVERLYQDLDDYHRAHLPWLFRQTNSAVRGPSFLKSIQDDENADVLVADSNQVVGFVHVRLFRAPDFPVFVPQLRGLVDTVFVDPSQRRLGVAARLMSAAEEWARARGAVEIDLIVYEFNEIAQDLFVEMGYGTLNRRMSKRLS